MCVVYCYFLIAIMYAVHNYLSKGFFCNPAMNDISAITKECSEVNVQYLARNLKIDYDDFRENPFEECIKHWIMRKYPVDEIGEPSWRTLAKAVKRIVLAHQIAKNHPKGN